MTYSQKLASRFSGVSIASRPAGPLEKTTPTMTNRITEKTRITVSMVLPR
jgi:hypothetical protein